MTGSVPHRPLQVAVIIPTKDRPEFLAEAIASARAQGHPPEEIIIVDDGSATPVDAKRLREAHGPTVRVLRNDASRGLAYSRNRGVEETCAEYVIHLDDDDLLAPDAIEQCCSVLQGLPEAELVFFAARGFGPNAEHFNEVQPEGVRRVIDLGRGREVLPNVILFGPELFAALLKTVPIAFQRVMVSKTLWETVSELRRNVYRLTPGVLSDDDARAKITGPLRDSEWARYAALVCRQTALINQPLYLQRCGNQGYSSLPANRDVHMRQGLEILSHLAEGTRLMPDLAQWRSQTNDALGQAHFDAAYQHHQSGHRKEAWTFLKKAMSSGIKMKHLRLAMRIGFN